MIDDLETVEDGEPFYRRQILGHGAECECLVCDNTSEQESS